MVSKARQSRRALVVCLDWRDKMKMSVVLGSLLILGVSPIYGEETSCDEYVSGISSQLKTDTQALKVYKKVEDKTKTYRELLAGYSEDLTTYRQDIAMLETAIRLNRVGIGVKPGVDVIDGIREMRVLIGVIKLAVKDVEDKTSDIVMVCVGRLRLSGGVRHFMLSVTKDDEGDSYWEARAL